MTVEWTLTVNNIYKERKTIYKWGNNLKCSVSIIAVINTAISVKYACFIVIETIMNGRRPLCSWFVLIFNRRDHVARCNKQLLNILSVCMQMISLHNFAIKYIAFMAYAFINCLLKRTSWGQYSVLRNHNSILLWNLFIVVWLLMILWKVKKANSITLNNFVKCFAREPRQLFISSWLCLCVSVFQWITFFLKGKLQ